MAEKRTLRMMYMNIPNKDLILIRLSAESIISHVRKAPKTIRNAALGNKSPKLKEKILQLEYGEAEYS